MRHARREANEGVKEKIKAGELGEDDGHRMMDEVQKLTNRYTEQIDDLLEGKEREVMSV